MDKSKSWLWFRVMLRGASGGTKVGIPSRVALKLSGCTDMQEFQRRHAEGMLNFPFSTTHAFRGQFRLVLLSLPLHKMTPRNHKLAEATLFL